MELNNSDSDTLEKKTAETEEEDTVIVPPRGGSRVRSRKIKGDIPWFSIVMAGISLIFCLITGYFYQAIMAEKEKDEMKLPDLQLVMPEEGRYIDYQGLKIPVMETVPLNGYDARGFYFDDDDYIRYEINGAEAYLGIDVSYHQKTIDWVSVAEAGIDFAMIRAGRRGYGEEGNLGVDTHYEENMTGAIANGIEVGVYFFSQALNLEELDEELELLLELIADYDITYPVVFDWEFITTSEWARTHDATGEQITELAVYFCEVVEEAGYIPAVYFNMDMAYRYLDLSQLTEYSFWLAELNVRPRFYYHFDMWQYTFTGIVSGIEGYVDMNICFRDFATESRSN